MEAFNFDEQINPVYRLGSDLLDHTVITSLNRAVKCILLRNYFPG